MREAMTKDREAKDLERLALDGERNIHRLCDQLLVNGRQRGDVEKERKIEENRVSEMAASLERYRRLFTLTCKLTYFSIYVDIQLRYKREIGNCLTAARNLRAEEERMDKEAYEKAEQAERLESEARALDEEAARLEREARQGGGW